MWDHGPGLSYMVYVSDVLIGGGVVKIGVLFSSRKWRSNQIATCTSEAYQRFLKTGFICIKVWGFALPLISNFLQISNQNEIILSH